MPFMFVHSMPSLLQNRFVLSRSNNSCGQSTTADMKYRFRVQHFHPDMRSFLSGTGAITIQMTILRQLGEYIYQILH